ncbi:alpha/beta hydrolase [Magnetofaba australis]|uniref:Putative alpha/beta fold family hydrolase n=1 Tax=Magnetofaba australis IT-1 TaxID=1434232 RepID=A0A1Y2K5M4_9PROT|nr:alpha/beta hydrolase [Magnetofaba australis]OSM04929.1 putative alpha/beta fold family hydrolase [Magnetofaba australis IT-1]
MHWSLWVGSVGAFYLGVCAVMYLTQRRQVFFPPRELLATPKEWGLSYETLTSESGALTLEHWWLPGLDNQPVVILFHGNASNISQVGDYATFFHTLGFGVLLTEYRGYGVNPGQPSEEGLYQDADSVWRLLVEEQGIVPERLILYGHSLGGGPATWLAQHRPVGALVIEGSFTSVPDRGAELYPYLPIRQLARIIFPNRERLAQIEETPTLIVHSREDGVIPIHHGRALFDAANKPKAFLATRGGHDGDLMRNSPQLRHAMGELKSRMAPWRKSSALASEE